MAKDLVQTKGSFVMRGIVDGTTGANFYNTGTIQQGKNEGKDYRSIRFQVQTSPTNKLSVEMFGMEQDYVYPYKRGKKGQKGTTLKHPFDQRDDLPEGFALIGVNVGLEQNDKGKNIRKSMVDYDAVDYIYETINDGDSVYVAGELQFSEYKNDQDEVVKQTKYIIKNVYKEAPIDFEDEKFEEVASFEQEIVFTGAIVNKVEKTVELAGYTIQYGNKFTECQFVIRPEEDKDIAKTAKAFSSGKIKFGDFVKVYGLCLNKVEVVEVALTAEEQAKAAKAAAKQDMFGGKKPKGIEKNAVTTYTTELQVTGADGSTYVVGLYSEEDFQSEEELINNDSIDPFADDDDSDDSDDSDELPFA